ncbi:MAG TPA: GNAT family N-acetyltransferase, partial [Microthrixaceae bacterium]|nr:GNAT family N-acetyltransferase [Microthrixaceae bacterium]
MERAVPDSWEADVVLRDGHTVRMRSIRPDDAGLITRFHERQSPESIYFRFFSPRPRLSERELEHFTRVDHRDRVAFVALLDDELVGVARYERYEGTDTAEVAFFVDDRHHGRGLATVMLEYLAAAARENGITRFRATTLPNNRKMLKVFASAGYEVASQLD